MAVLVNTPEQWQYTIKNLAVIDWTKAHPLYEKPIVVKRLMDAVCLRDLDAFIEKEYLSKPNQYQKYEGWNKELHRFWWLREFNDMEFQYQLRMGELYVNPLEVAQTWNEKTPVRKSFIGFLKRKWKELF